jgi:hypothetical protein
MLAVAPNSQISLQYNDIIPILSVVSTMSVLNSVIGTITVSPSRPRVGFPILVTVNDTDLDWNTLAFDTIQVTLIRTNTHSPHAHNPVHMNTDPASGLQANISCGPDIKILTLNETGVSTGIFTATINTSSSRTLGTGTLNFAEPGAQFTASYLDTTPTPDAVRSTNGLFGIEGRLTLSEVRLNGLVTVTLEDPDASSTGSLSVRVVALSASASATVDSITLSLLPANPPSAPGIFVGSFRTSENTNMSSGILRGVVPGMSLVASYNDTSPSTTASTSALVLSSDAAELFALPYVLPAGTLLRITLNDQDLNNNPTAIDRAWVRVSSSDSSESPENVMLTETTPTSSVFTGSVRTRTAYGNSASGDMGLNVVAGQVITVSYTDQAPVSNITASVQVVASAYGLLQAFPTKLGQVRHRTCSGVA